jgi:hypothetical protein
MSVAEFILRTTMPRDNVDRLQNRDADWLQTRLNDESAWLDGKLRKRYAVPFAAPVPPLVMLWISRLVTPDAYMKLGVRQTDEQFKALLDRATETRDEIDEAADGQNGKFELPLRADTTANGISKGGPKVYSEQSPYVAFDRQAATARGEDTRGDGSQQ